MDRFRLLCNIGELNHLFRESASIESFLQRIVVLVTEHMKSDVCSIYLYDEDSDELVMKATEGLNPDSIDHVRMKLGDGLTGKALKELRPICVSRASKETDFKVFVGCGEEPFENFLAIPILRGIERIGVLVLQRKKRRRFIEDDVMACKAVASQLANIVENARFIMAMHAPVQEQRQTSSQTWGNSDLGFIRGKAASEGFAYSTAYVLDKKRTFSSLLKRSFDRMHSIEEFNTALSLTEDQLETLQKQVEEKLSDAASLIFASHLLILKDKQFVGVMRTMIAEGANPPGAIIEISKQYIDTFASSSNFIIREKVQDVEDLAVRLVSNLAGESEGLEGYGSHIVIAREIFPSDLLRMSSEDVKGIVLVCGGATSHLSILARSLQIPMVIANRQELTYIEAGTNILVDADSGNVYVDPAEDVVESFRQRQQTRATVADEVAEVETNTKDGTHINLMANINLLTDLKLAKRFHSQGIGLYRTEFPFIIRSDFPSEEEQYVTYRKLIEAMGEKPVTFRTLDIGGDKVLSYYHDAHEQNPTMGMRSIRFSLQNKNVFTEQIRAILRAGVGADLRIMFPMISSVDEFIEARDVTRDCSENLSTEGIEHNEKPLIGLMAELPSVAEIAVDLAREADFFSIGTNDFVQFALGVDRTNENVESFYVPHNPAILRAFARIVSGAVEQNIPVSVCGDMAHEEQYIPFLLGIGVDTLSVDPAFTPRVQRSISELDMDKVRELTARVLKASTISEAARLLGIGHSGV